MRNIPVQKLLIRFLGLATIAGILIALPAVPLAAIQEGVTVTKNVTSALSSDPLLGKRSIEVYIHEGRVALVGFVENQKEMDRAIELAKNADGVQSVQNSLMFIDPKGYNIIPRDLYFESP